MARKADELTAPVRTLSLGAGRIRRLTLPVQVDCQSAALISETKAEVDLLIVNPALPEAIGLVDFNAPVPAGNESDCLGR